MMGFLLTLGFVAAVVFIGKKFFDVEDWKREGVRNGWNRSAAGRDLEAVSGGPGKA